MHTKHFLLAALCAAAMQSAYAIEATYESSGGVLANVFQTNCLFCHSSTLSGPARNGAPVGLNWDVYDVVVANFDRIATRAIVEESMPPGFSGISKLNQDQKTALLAWKDAGFPKAGAPVSMIDPQYEGSDGIFEQVFATNCVNCHASTRTGPDRHGAPVGFNWDVYATAATKGDRIIARAVILQTMPPASSGIPHLDAEQQAAMLAWQAAGFPDIAPDSVSEPNFDYIGQTLRLPVVIVGSQSYDVQLHLFPLAGSPAGFGFELVSATLTTATSAKAATYAPNTGLVTIPDVLLLNNKNPNPTPSSHVSAQMQLVPGSSPLKFSVTALNYITP